MAVTERAAYSPTRTPAPAQIAVMNPLTGEPINTIPIMGADEVRAAAERARAAQPAWEALGVRERVRIMRQLERIVWERQQPMIDQIRQETGKAEQHALVEIFMIDTILDYFSRLTPKILRPQRRTPLFPIVHRASVHYKARPVVGFITPWNYPLLNGFADLLQALFAGSAIILKPSEITPFTAFLMLEWMHEAGIPQDIAQIVTGDGSTGRALIDHVDYISFTGSTAVGRKVAVQAAERLIPYSLELGGKDAYIVLDDADVEWAVVRALQSKLENAGQTCVSPERFYVAEPVYDAFIERMLARLNEAHISPNPGLDVHMGSLTNEREIERCEAHISDAVARGARVLFGGRRRPDLGPLFFEPTLLVDVNHDMLVMRDETFGPLIPVMKFTDVDEAVRLANDSIYGLSGAVMSRNHGRAKTIALRLQTGDVAINRPQLTFGTTSVPMGGEKASGIARRNGREGLLRFVTTQSIVTDTLFGQRHSLRQADPSALFFYRLLRKVRRFLPA